MSATDFPCTRWQIDGLWLLSHSGTRLARVVQGGLALYDKKSHHEVVLTASDLDTILRAREDASMVVTVADPEIRLR